MENGFISFNVFRNSWVHLLHSVADVIVIFNSRRSCKEYLSCVQMEASMITSRCFHPLGLLNSFKFILNVISKFKSKKYFWCRRLICQWLPTLKDPIDNNLSSKLLGFYLFWSLNNNLNIQIFPWEMSFKRLSFLSVCLKT